MTVFSTFRERFSAPGISTGGSQTGDGSDEETDPPFAGYDKLDGREVIDGLSAHSQVELTALEGYERSHKSREPVLDKLRYMRGSEPFAGYDALGVEEIVATLGEADSATLKKVRSYERKFCNRPAVLEEVVRVQHERRAAQPAVAPPAYEPVSARP